VPRCGRFLFMGGSRYIHSARSGSPPANRSSYVWPNNIICTSGCRPVWPPVRQNPVAFLFLKAKNRSALFVGSHKVYARCRFGFAYVRFAVFSAVFDRRAESRFAPRFFSPGDGIPSPGCFGLRSRTRLLSGLAVLNRVRLYGSPPMSCVETFKGLGLFQQTAFCPPNTMLAGIRHFTYML